MSKGKPIIIVDVDGTICDSSERLEAIGFDPSKPMEEWPTNWGDYMKDKPIVDMIDLVAELYENYEIWILTIRDPRYKEGTIEWFDEHLVVYNEAFFIGDPKRLDRSPSECKREWLDNLNEEDRSRIRFAFEDSPSMVKVFRDAGIKCFDVGPFIGSM